MINRISLLRNIGQFDNVTPNALALNRISLVYSENGRGKTTIASTIRSLATGDPIPINERRRLGSQNPPHVILEHDTQRAMFQNGAWDRTISSIAIFDDTFIDQNVNSGLAVQTHHRQNLHELILGQQAVSISRELQQAVEEIETHNRELRIKTAAIPEAIRGPYGVEDFCNLPLIADVEQQIAETERTLKTAQENVSIRSADNFRKIALPSFDIWKIENVLSETLASLDAKVMGTLQSHFSSIGTNGEAWISDGIARILHDKNQCPFCAQDLRGSNLIDHYRNYFSKSYQALKSELDQTIRGVSNVHSGDVRASFERAVRVCIERHQFWEKFISMPSISIDTATIVRDWKVVADGLLQLLERKKSSPLERVELPSSLRDQIRAYGAHLETVNATNSALDENNVQIELSKERSNASNVSTLSQDLTKLKAARARHDAAISIACGEYVTENAAKAQAVERRDNARTRLEQHRTSVFPAYQAATNHYLQRLNAAFRLDSVSYANNRAGSICTYNVVINAVPVSVGDGRTGQASFRNTLSAGDRNTLALAFFFASLDQDSNLANKVVVIDDPISSLDDHRALATVQEIKRLVNRVRQVIVLSHSKPLLNRLWEGVAPTLRTAIQIVRDGAGSTLQQWDVSLDSITEHDKRAQSFQEYLAGNTGENRTLAQAIRPHLEAFLRVVCPGSFPPETLLGQFADACQRRLGTADEVLNQAKLQELREIVEYGNGFHHDTNPAWETVTINDGELNGFVQRTLAFCRP